MNTLRRRRVALTGFLVLWAGPLTLCADDTLILATTTSTDNSGLLATIHPDFEKRTGLHVRVVAKGTGASLQLARDGNADCILVHARVLEDRFVAEGHGVMRRDVMYNDFVLLGPKDDPAGVRQARDPASALRRIADARQWFVSRGDRSGTHLREQQLWRRSNVKLESTTRSILVRGTRTSFASIRPFGTWYLSIGQGMGKTIMLATEKRAYTLADRGTFYSFSLADESKTDLVILCQGHKGLHNPYGVIAVNPQRHPRANFAAARKYIQWITSPRVQQMIGQFKVQGRVLFHPHAMARKPR